MRLRRLGLLLLFLCSLPTWNLAFGIERFPPPDFEEGYQMPAAQHPTPTPLWREYGDVGVLLAALLVSAFLALRMRSRTGMVWLSLFSLAYFGFFRKGCVCSVGSLQNVALGLFDKEYLVALPVLFFFALPLVFALLFGRVFCAGVCPLGVVQDLVLIKPVRIPGWLNACLGFFPYVYLAAALAAVGVNGTFLICRYDPFVSLFRLQGPTTLLLLGGIFLTLSLFVGRPYCRFVCPYAVLLRICSRWSWKHLTITPDECVVCSLCHDACPFDAIQAARPGPRKNPKTWMLGLLLLFPAAGAGLGFLGGPLFARQDPLVRTAERVWTEEALALRKLRRKAMPFGKAGWIPEYCTDLPGRERNAFKLAQPGGWAFSDWLRP